jgi:hypothetical protein
MARRRPRLRPILLACAFAAACADAPARSPVSSSSAAPTPAPLAAPAPNAAPELHGFDDCLGPVGRDHVWVLRVTDADGDALSWRAEKTGPQGQLTPLGLEGLASGSEVRLVYSPPRDAPDLNTIVVTVTDGRGGAVTKSALAKSG